MSAQLSLAIVLQLKGPAHTGGNRRQEQVAVILQRNGLSIGLGPDDRLRKGQRRSRKGVGGRRGPDSLELHGLRTRRVYDSQRAGGLACRGGRKFDLQLAIGVGGQRRSSARIARQHERSRDRYAGDGYRRSSAVLRGDRQRGGGRSHLHLAEIDGHRSESDNAGSIPCTAEGNRQGY